MIGLQGELDPGWRNTHQLNLMPLRVVNRHFCKPTRDIIQGKLTIAIISLHCGSPKYNGLLYGAVPSPQSKTLCNSNEWSFFSIIDVEVAETPLLSENTKGAIQSGQRQNSNFKQHSKGNRTPGRGQTERQNSTLTSPSAQLTCWEVKVLLHFSDLLRGQSPSLH